MSGERLDGGRGVSVTRTIGAGIVSGLVAGTGMGVILSVGTGLMPLIGALYGRETFFWGWVSHLFNSVVFALFFVAIVSHPIVRSESQSLGTYATYGIVYGAFLEIVTGGVLFPLWLRAAGEPELSFPFFPIPGTAAAFLPAIFLGIAHIVYGVLLGATYAVVSGTSGNAPAESAEVPQE